MRVMPAALWRAAARLFAENRLFAVVLVPALLLRVDAELGYRWQSWFNDSFNYVTGAVTMTLDPTRPSGYSVYLRVLEPFHSYALVTISQHLMGLLVAVMIYALARYRLKVPAWIAVLFSLPVLYDGFEIQLEHLIMADTLFLFLAMAAVTLVLWSRRPSWRVCLVAGVLLGLSAAVRATGLPLLAVFAVYLIIRFLPGVFGTGRLGWRGWRELGAAVAACGVAFAVPVVAYEGGYDLQHGEFAMTESTGVFLYSRVMTFADCSRMQLPPDLLPLCTAVPPDKRPIAQAYIWTRPARWTGSPPRSSRRCPTSSRNSSPSRRSKRSRSTTRAPSSTTLGGPSGGIARSSPMARPMASTYSDTTRLISPADMLTAATSRRQPITSGAIR